ncbi:MAG: HEXXH motif-containing putative peptide modification protein [Elusimicrobiota bacterium]|nr:HEXXH motif-containing putative peptide modification protein [Elusimicrobiota bacterium]
MRLDADDWAVSGGTGAGWRAVMDLRGRHALARVKAAAAALARSGPAETRRRCAEGLRRFLAKDTPERRRMLGSDPALDYWLHLRERHFAGDPATPEDWDLHYGLFAAFPLSLCWQRREKGVFEASLDPDGRLHLPGTPYSLGFGAANGRRPVKASVAPGFLTAAVAGLPVARATRAAFEAAGPGGAAAGPATLRRAPSAAPGLVSEHLSWLLNHGVVMHGLDHPAPAAEEKFASVIAAALEQMAAQDPGLHAEMTELTRVVVPLRTSDTMASVSSSYVSMRGVICLSHADSVILQAETLIHEFCHQKMNQLLEVDPLLEPGQGGQVFYSPWRKDARRLRGLLLGAHAFINVASHLLKALSREGYRREESVDPMVNVALRAEQSEDALRTVAAYADLTEFGARFTGRLWRELMTVRHGMSWFPPALLEEARATHAAHRGAWALPGTGLHRPEGFADRVGRAPFLTPGESGAVEGTPEDGAEADAAKKEGA